MGRRCTPPAELLAIALTRNDYTKFGNFGMGAKVHPGWNLAHVNGALPPGSRRKFTVPPSPLDTSDGVDAGVDGTTATGVASSDTQGGATAPSITSDRVPLAHAEEKQQA